MLRDVPPTMLAAVAGALAELAASGTAAAAGGHAAGQEALQHFALSLAAELLGWPKRAVPDAHLLPPAIPALR